MKTIERSTGVNSLAFATETRGYLEMKLAGFRRDYPENHCMVETAKRYLAQCDAVLAKVNSDR